MSPLDELHSKFRASKESHIWFNLREDEVLDEESISEQRLAGCVEGRDVGRLGYFEEWDKEVSFLLHQDLDGGSADLI